MRFVEKLASSFMIADAVPLGGVVVAVVTTLTERRGGRRRFAA